MTNFPARYEGWCPNCETKILPGHEVRFDDGALVHIDCQPKEDPVRPICQECWMETSVSGACACPAS